MQIEAQTPRPRRHYRPGIAALVLFAIIVTLGVIIARPAKFFEAPAVQSDAACTMRRCPNTTEEPDRQTGRNSQDIGQNYQDTRPR